MYKGSNAEKLNNMAMYDLLCRMQEMIDKMDGGGCVIDYASGKEQECYAADCRSCIQEFLNEPHD